MYNVTKRVLGIPVDYNDVEKRVLEFDKIHSPLNPYNVENTYTHADRLIVNFMVQNLYFEYFSIGDIGSQLGGLAASLRIVAGSAGTIIMFKFIFDLARLIQRKDKHKLRCHKIKSSKKILPYLLDAIKQGLKTST